MPLNQESFVEFKREDLQPVFSFKIRGAYNRITQWSVTGAPRGIICVPPHKLFPGN